MTDIDFMESLLPKFGSFWPEWKRERTLAQTELLRKMFANKPIQAALDAVDAWALEQPDAKSPKLKDIAARVKSVGAASLIEEGESFESAWGRLTDEQRGELLAVAKGVWQIGWALNKYGDDPADNGPLRRELCDLMRTPRIMAQAREHWAHLAKERMAADRKRQAESGWYARSERD